MSEKTMTTTEIIAELDTERQKFTKSDQAKMVGLIDQLVASGEYVPTPHTEKRKSQGVKNPFLEMVESYGADWHRYSEPHNCPSCGTDLCDRKNGPPYKREISSGGPCWCPECKGVFDRYPKPRVAG